MEIQSSKGVQALIDRLKSEGIQSGEDKAKEITEIAHQKARKIIADAKQEADLIRTAARDESERMRVTAEEAIRIAARDALLSLKGRMTQLFRQELTKQVNTEFKREEFLRLLLLEVCRKKLPDLSTAENISILLPLHLTNLDEIQSAPETTENKMISQFILSIRQECLNQGVSFVQGNGEGIQVRLENEEILIDLNDKAVGELLIQYLLPRFRTILEGYVL